MTPLFGMAEVQARGSETWISRSSVLGKGTEESLGLTSECRMVKPSSRHIKGFCKAVSYTFGLNISCMCREKLAESRTDFHMLLEFTVFRMKGPHDLPFVHTAARRNVN